MITIAQGIVNEEVCGLQGDQGNFCVFPQAGLFVGFYLRKTRLDTLVGALGGVGRAGLGWAWGLALVGAPGWVGAREKVENEKTTF